MLYSIIKRITDLIVSLVTLLVLSPIIVVVSITIFFTLGRPVFFCQYRPGKDQKLFKLYKFRTMKNSQSENALENVGTDGQRLTKLGLWLRKTSLDELPSLYNVIKGEMSLVGPRPLLKEYLPLYSIKQAERHKVKPGITGLAQCLGRNRISWERKFYLDVWYVRKRNFCLDAKILTMTLSKVILQKDINSKAHPTSRPFTGKKS